MNLLILLLSFHSLFASDILPQKSDISPIRTLTDQYVTEAQKLDPFYDFYTYAKRPGFEFGNEFDLKSQKNYRALILNSYKKFKALKTKNQTDIDKDTTYLFSQNLEDSLWWIQHKEQDEIMRVLSVTHLGNRIKSYAEMGAGYSSFPFDELSDYQNYIKRSLGVKKWVNDYITATKKINAKGFLASRDNIDRLIEDLNSLIPDDITKSRFYNPINLADKNLTKDQMSTLKTNYVESINNNIYPEIKKMILFLKTNLKNTRTGFGLYGLKKYGEEIYKKSIDESTDNVGYSAAELHQLGLQEVEKDKKQIEDIKNALGYSKMSFREFIKFYKDRPESYFTKKEDLEKTFREAQTLINSKINNYFSLIPTTPLELRAIDNFSSPAGSYSGLTETIDKAYFNYNGANIKATDKAGTYTLFAHEGIPGHHFQMSINYDLKKHFGKFRGEMYGSNAFCEGWALYAEYLGREMGIFNTLDLQLGNLNNDMLRAVRLVVDTGIHHFGWSREKAIQYMSEHVSNDIGGVTSEIDRYSVWPGQALGYKVGQLEILKLRKQAESELGNQFNIKDFHKVVLESGNINLKLLSDKVNNWIKSLKKKITP